MTNIMCAFLSEFSGRTTQKKKKIEENNRYPLTYNHILLNRFLGNRLKA